MDFIISESLQKDVLDSLRLYIKHNKPVLLSGPVGSGKSSLLRHVAALSGRTSPLQLLTIQLARDLDSKTLLGSYHCTQVGAEFHWVPGLLTMAVMSSSWLILEDIDNASVDLMSILLPVIQRKVLHIPEIGRTIPVGQDFRLFATSRMATSTFPSLHADAVLLSHFKHLHVPQMRWNELSTITKQVFPNLSLLLPRLLETFQLLSSSESAELDFTLKRAIHARAPSLRDFFRLCRRLNKYATTNSMERISDVFLDVFSCYCAFIPDFDSRLQLAKILGAILGLSNTDVEFHASKRSVSLIRRENEMKVTVGHTDLPIKHNSQSTGSNLVQSIPQSTDDKSTGFSINRNSQSTGSNLVQSIPQSTDDKSTGFSLHGSALRLIDQLAVCIANKEFPLLVGETGTGKTTVVQFLAEMCNRRLHVINLSHQSEIGDLLGGYKPVEFALLVAPVKDAFLALFASSFSVTENERFLSNFQSAFVQKNYGVLVKGMRHITNSALRKKKKDGEEDAKEEAWVDFEQRLVQLEQQFTLSQKSLLFSFLEGKLVTSYREGDWVLLDEINLASPEVLAGLHSFLDSSVDSFVLSEKGEGEIVQRHADFRVFACMNPATDVGKKDLPIEIRSRATEIFCDDLTDRGEVAKIVVAYLSEVVEDTIVQKVVELYFRLREKAEKELVDDSNRKVHYSLRTFTRALQFAAKVASSPSLLLRFLYEGFCLSYLTQLNRASQLMVKDLLVKTLFEPSTQNLLSLPLPKPSTGQFVQVQGYWLPRGTLPPIDDGSYILTETVKSNLAEISRAISAGQLPVLLQGETSVGKTSMITWLAKKTGNKCVRINNHEHTDIQDYIGSWQSDQDGKLVFREGVLLQAMRKGFWIILDELNLAPSDVLEALNRLLDANRELFVPECQEIVKAHPDFMLFGTQNPPGYYGGRKTLSRAFRNRFIEIHFGEIPAKELEEILHKRGALPPAYAKKMIDVMLELQAIRKMGGIFAGKQGFITLRDLFRWAERYRLTESPKDAGFFDWEQHLADHGFLLLAGRVRKQEEAVVVKATMEKHFKRVVDEDALFGASTSALTSSTSRTIQSFTEFSSHSPEFSHLVWTSNLKRLVALAGSALAYGEAVLLVGETGCGKTTISQVYAQLQNSRLFSLNCHMNTETSDFLGGLRPARKEGSSKLFEWKDGVLVEAMKEGGVLLLDEISLADDSVLERINSVLEPERKIVLTERGGDIEELQADKGFRFVATMNPGGDFGKKELSPALRNRFTEVWCTNLSIPEDVRIILHHNLLRKGTFVVDEATKTKLVDCMVDFVVWIKQQNLRMTVSSRDLMMWIAFINQFLQDPKEKALVATSVRDPFLAYYHGTCMVFGSHAQVLTTKSASGLTWEESIQQFLRDQNSEEDDDVDMEKAEAGLVESETTFGVEPFFMTKRVSSTADSSKYCFDSGSVRQNVMRILRSLVVTRGILLEGPPGVGKTSIVQALAAKTGHQVVRINLSEQTDISDLFGADMPVEGQTAQFAWQDGPFLQAMKKGAWILLDELNLASQSVLEGLNACLDHRSEVFIPELGRSFTVDADSTRIFACQNPLNQGSGRKGLPASFLNRFTQVYIEPLLESDLLAICLTAFPTLPSDHVASLLRFNAKVEELIRIRKIGSSGQPWEFNLRDVMRSCAMARKHVENGDVEGQKAFQNALLDLVYVGRFRTDEDRRRVAQLAFDFGLLSSIEDFPRNFLKTELTEKSFLIGCCTLPRSDQEVATLPSEKLQLLHSQSGVLEKLALCIVHNFVSILAGSSGVGKSSLVEVLASLTGRKLRVFSMNSATDAAELLGGFEQRVSRDKTSKVTFEWRNSEVVEAMLAGDWLLIDNANLCNPAVLDRLNSVLEPGGELLLSERGSVNGEMVVVRPKDGFRLFLTVNPQYGELSRAMRNRGVEIYVEETMSRRDGVCVLMKEGLQSGVAETVAETCQNLGVNLEQLRNVGGELAMRMEENSTFDVQTAFKAALPHATIPFDTLKTLIFHNHKNSSLVPFPVLLVELMRNRLQTNIHRKANALAFVTEFVQKTSKNDLVRDSLKSFGLWLFGLSLKENESEEVVGMAEKMVVEGRVVLPMGSEVLRDVRWGKEAMVGFEWKHRVMDVVEKVVEGEGVQRSFDQRLRALLDFVQMYVRAFVEELVDGKEGRTEKEDFAEDFVVALWLRSLMAAVHFSVQRKAQEDDTVNVTLLWRLLKKEVLFVTGRLGDGPLQAVNLRSTRQRLDEDLWSEESVLNGETRKKLGADEPFKSKEDFERMARIRRTNEPDEVLAVLHRVLSLNDESLMVERSNDGSLWRLFQLAFCMKSNSTLHFLGTGSFIGEQREEGLRALWNVGLAIPWVLREVALLLSMTTFSLSPLQQSALKFALTLPFRRDAYSNSEGPKVLDCDEEKLWSKEVMLRLANGQTREDSSRDVGLWRLGDAEVHVERLKDLQMVLWKRLLDKKTGKSEVHSVENLAKVLAHGLRDVDRKLSLLEDRDSIPVRLEAVWTCLITFPNVSGNASVRAEAGMEGRLLSQLRSDVEKSAERSEDEKEAMQSVMLGLVLLRLFAPPSVDPVQEMQLVRNCLHYQLEECEGSLAAVKEYFTALYGALTEQQKRQYGPVVMEVYQERLEECQRRLKEEDMQQQVYRPSSSLYGATTQDCAFMKTSLLQRLTEMFLSSQERSVGEKVKMLSGWLPSVVERMEELRDKYLVYRDIVGPFLAGVQQVVQGLEVLAAMWDQQDFLLNCRVTAASVTNVLDCVETVGNPAGSQSGRLVDVAERLWKGRNAVLRMYKGAPLDQLNLEVQLMELVLRLLNVEVEMGKNDRGSTWTKAMTLRFSVFDHLAKVWSIIEEERKKVELENENLYKFAKDSDKGALERIFPTYRADFDDENEDETTGNVTLSSKSHLRFVETAQNTFVTLFGHTDSSKIQPEKDQTELEVKKVLRLSFEISKDVVQKCPRLHDFHIDTTSFLHKIQDEVSLVSKDGGIQKNEESFNFYHDACVDEAKKCVPLLVDAKERVLCLLDQWPAHPVLNDIVKTVDKMRMFGMTEPLAKLLTGMELVLDKCQSWEVNAHAGVSLQPQMTAMGDLILQWRRLELREWRSALDVVSRERRQEASRWWLHLYNAVQETFQGKSGEEVATFVKIVQKFMETSTLGTFGGRLDLLKNFLGHLSTIKAMTKSEVRAILYNLQAFYSQFEQAIQKKIAEVRKPIEKELKEAIKIIQWNQMNYWALKETIAKAHRVVHNHVRKFQAVLDEPVSLDNGSLGGEVQLTVEKATGLKTSLGPPRTVPEGFRLKNLPMVSGEKLLKKGRKLVREVLRRWKCSEKIEFVQEVADEYGTRFKAIEVKTVDVSGKEGNKKIKELASRRRLAFKHLTETLDQLGLSYRKGMMVAGTENSNAAFVVAPPDFLVDETGNEGVRKVWEKCEESFFGKYAQLALFRRQLETPAKTISARDVAVMKGYVEHLTHLILQRRKITADIMSAVSRTRSHEKSLQRFSEVFSIAHSLPGSTLVDFAVKGRGIATQLQAILRKYSLLLSSAPVIGENSSSLTLKTCRLLYGSENELWRNSETWTELAEKIKKCQKSLDSIKVSSHTSKEASAFVFHGHEEWKEIEEYSAVFLQIDGDLRVIRDTLSPPNDSVPVDQLLAQMSNYTQDWKDSLTNVGVPEETKVNVEGTVVRCLKAIERLSQSTENSSDSILSSPFSTVNSNDVACLDMDKVLRSVQVLVKQAEKVPWNSLAKSEDLKAHESFFELLSVTLGQMGSFSMELLQTAAQLMNMLMNVFTELVVNGFGAPDEGEESEEIKGKEGEFEETEETGMGEGEGVKDVSDKIESQDQLEDLKKDKEEKKKEEEDARKDVPDEEHGIEMTDDFEGEMHDVPINQQDEEDEEDMEVPDVENQMGDFDSEDNVEHLEEKFWEGDEEDENEKDDEQKPEDEKKTDKNAKGKKAYQRDEMAAANDDLEGETDEQEDQLDEGQPQEDGEEGENAEEFAKQNPNDPRVDNDDEEEDVPPGDDSEDINMDPVNEEDLDEEATAAEDFQETLAEPGENEPESGGEEDVEREEQDVEGGEKKEEDESLSAAAQTKSNADESQANEDMQTEKGQGLEGHEPNEGNDEDEMERENDDNAEESGKRTGMMDSSGSGRSLEKLEKNKGEKNERQSEGNERRKKEKRSLDARKEEEEKKVLGDLSRAYNKRLKISKSSEKKKNDAKEVEKEEENGEGDMYEHVEDEKEKWDKQTVDKASREKAREQRNEVDMDDEKKAQFGEEDPDLVEELKDESDVEMEENNDETPELKVEQGKSKRRKDQKDSVAKMRKKGEMESEEESGKMKIEGDEVPTLGADFEGRSFFEAKMELLQRDISSEKDVEEMRRELVQAMSTWSRAQYESVAAEMAGMLLWRKYEAVTQSLSHELCEQLRLVLEPTKKSKLRGDYRTGKRLNMRKLLAYVASDFRKDKIWLRRSLPTQRQYQILMAVDDSSSMNHNQTKELAFESVAVISNAMSLLDVGQLGICSFGETVELLHPFQVPFTTADGATILSRFSFAQNKTNVAEMLELTWGVFVECRQTIQVSSSSGVSQLLLIVSDGRGIFREGVEKVKKAVRKLMSVGVFIVFVILDKPDMATQQASIMDIRVPVFGGPSQGVQLRSYMQDFPFPFYLVLKDVRELPSTLCDAMRQWFELISSRD